MSSPSARSCSRTGSRSPSIARWQIRRASSGPDITAAVSLESYPRFIKGGFQDYEGLWIKRSTVDSKHVPSVRSRLPGNKVFWSLPQKVVESLKLTGPSGDHSKSPIENPGTAWELLGQS